MNILITGASGYIGNNVTDFFSEKYHVLAPGHKQLDLLDNNEVQRYVRNHSVDVVVHCAAVGSYGAHLYVKDMFHDNIRMFFNLARCRKYYKRMIHIGSGAVYDKRYPIVTIKETDFGKRIPDDEYGLYKYICSDYIHRADNMVDLRVFGLFGEGEDYRFRFISNAICRHIFHLPITIKQNVRFDYLYIRDFLSIIEYFVKHKPKYTAYNIGSGKTYSLVSLANILNKVGDRREKILVSRKGYAHEYSCNAERLYSEVKNISLTPIQESIANLYYWYRKNKGRINPKNL